MFILKNALLELAIHPSGAELQKISAVQKHLEFMWDGNPEIWAGHAPNLFPIVGALKEDTFTFEYKNYTLPKHGFVRRNPNFTVENQSDQHLALKLTSSEATLKNYPFHFEYLVSYKLVDNQITVTYTVKNTGQKIMYFSVGGHPAFKCPLYPNEVYSDYSLEFEKAEHSLTHLINMSNGLLNLQTEPVFKSPKSIALHEHIFDQDALVFKDLKSDKITLNSKTHGEILTLSFTDFPFLGIWAKSKANFVCIEPWQGVADSENSNQILQDKEGIVALDNHKTYSASYTIEIHKAHLA
ncbi:aldose 1-epimerase family protein [Gelidibacter salicanalis]|uniref:Aldose 1-epimerase family protein n=1 Tax=Gelidibacter salicanalis TaxID=291193 RepID=A0A934NGT7_9FLAO|nr:aldose 1-epimerase family protein [Gelidibacter salicanalis]MBJ7879976.1 aldose 1-epimerase family protein [Gelidibacter salicanalis]